MWIKFVGHPDGADVPDPDSYLGAELHFPYDVPVDVKPTLAKRLLEQPSNFRPAAPLKTSTATTAEKPAKAGKEE